MTEEELAMKRAGMIHKLLLNESGTGKFADLGMFKALVMAFSESDVDELIKNLEFFNPIFSPGSASYIFDGLPRDSKKQIHRF